MLCFVSEVGDDSTQAELRSNCNSLGPGAATFPWPPLLGARIANILPPAARCAIPEIAYMRHSVYHQAHCTSFCSICLPATHILCFGRISTVIQSSTGPPVHFAPILDEEVRHNNLAESEQEGGQAPLPLQILQLQLSPGYIRAVPVVLYGRPGPGRS